MQQPEISIHPLIGRLHSNSQRAGVILYLTALLFGAYIRTKSWQVSWTSIDSKGSTYFT